MYDDSDFIETNDRFAPEAAAQVIDCWQAACDPKRPLVIGYQFAFQLLYLSH